jgi:biofilm protein TabA
MIATQIKDAHRQTPGADGFTRAFAFLRRPGLTELPDGRYPIDGERIFALVQRYETAAVPEPRFEAHRDYIDVQYVAAGSEMIGWAPLTAMAVRDPYDPGKDACFGSAPYWTPVLLREGDLAVFWPEDAHAPRLAAGVPGTVFKIVVKISLEAGI